APHRCSSQTSTRGLASMNDRGAREGDDRYSDQMSQPLIQEQSFPGPPVTRFNISGKKSHQCPSLTLTFLPNPLARLGAFSLRFSRLNRAIEEKGNAALPHLPYSLGGFL